MPRLTMEESVGKTFELLDEDSVHECVIQNIEISVFKDPVKGDRKNLNWTFVIQTPGEWEGKRVWGNTSMVFNTNPNCKLRNWAQSVLATELDAGYELDTDDLIGRKCRVVIGHRKYMDKQGVEGTKQFVADVMPPRQNVFGGDNLPPF